MLGWFRHAAIAMLATDDRAISTMIRNDDLYDQRKKMYIPNTQSAMFMRSDEGKHKLELWARGAGQGSSHTFVLDRMGVQVCACVCMSCVHLSHTDAGARTTSLTRGQAVEPTRPVRCVPVGHAWHARAHIRVWALAAPHAFARTRLHARMHTCARMCTHLPHMCTHVLCACATHVPRTCRAGAAHVHACARTHVHGRTHAHPGV